MGKAFPLRGAFLNYKQKGGLVDGKRKENKPVRTPYHENLSG